MSVSMRDRRLAPPARNRSSVPSRAGIAAALGLVALVWVLAAAGALLAFQIFNGSAFIRPATVGETVQIPRGLLRVDAVIPESMAPTQGDNFARAGMNMSAMAMDMAAPGYRRFTVLISLMGQEDGLPYSAEQFQITSEGVPPTAPLRHQLGDGWVGRNSATTGSLVFEVPDEAEELLLSFAQGNRSIALHIKDSGHDH